MRPNPQFPADLVTFTEEVLNGNFIFFAVTSLLLYMNWKKRKQFIWCVCLDDVGIPQSVQLPF